MKIPYFLRDWKLTVTPLPAGRAQPLTATNHQGDNGALKCTFDIEQAANVAYWFADIAVYNAMPLMSEIIQKGDLVTLEAGYQTPPAGAIFSGRVFQPLWERSSETDYRLTLHCLVGLFEDETGHVETTIPAGMSYLDAVFQVANAAGLRVGSLDGPVLQKKVYPRAVPVFGRASAFFLGVAVDTHLQMWMGWKGVNIRSLASEDTIPDAVYVPPFSPASQTASKNGTKQTLIGTPQQTQWGISFRTLLDSGIELGSVVKVENALVSRILQIPGGDRVPFVKDGLYSVARIRHTGDTRGNEWNTEITGIQQNLVKSLEAGVQY